MSSASIGMRGGTNDSPRRHLGFPANERVTSAGNRQGVGVPVTDEQSREEFDTALSRIRHDIKGRLVIHGFFGSISYRDIEVDHLLSGSTIEVTVKGRTVERSFSRQEIEDCRLRVSGAVLSGVISMVDEFVRIHPK